jgi:hypothetical protein
MIKYPILTGCFHKYDNMRQPKHRNCDNCWFHFFSNNLQMVEVTDTMYKNFGKSRVVESQGEKFFKKFTQFMSLMTKKQAELEAKHG